MELMEDVMRKANEESQSKGEMQILEISVNGESSEEKKAKMEEEKEEEMKVVGDKESEEISVLVPKSTETAMIISLTYSNIFHILNDRNSRMSIIGFLN